MYVLPQVLNNNPLVGHKTIPTRNLYSEADSGSPVDSGLPLDGATGTGNRTWEPSGGRTQNGPESHLNRICPVCDEDFG